MAQKKKKMEREFFENIVVFFFRIFLRISNVFHRISNVFVLFLLLTVKRKKKHSQTEFTSEESWFDKYFFNMNNKEQFLELI